MDYQCAQAVTVSKCTFVQHILHVSCSRAVVSIAELSLACQKLGAELKEKVAQAEAATKEKKASGKAWHPGCGSTPAVAVLDPFVASVSTSGYTSHGACRDLSKLGFTFRTANLTDGQGLLSHRL